MCFWFYQAQSPFLTVGGGGWNPRAGDWATHGVPSALCDAAVDNIFCDPWVASSPRALGAGCGQARLSPGSGTASRHAAGGAWGSQTGLGQRVSAMGSAHAPVPSGLGRGAGLEPSPGAVRVTSGEQDHPRTGCTGRTRRETRVRGRPGSCRRLESLAGAGAAAGSAALLHDPGSFPRSQSPCPRGPMAARPRPGS